MKFTAVSKMPFGSAAFGIFSAGWILRGQFFRVNAAGLAEKPAVNPRVKPGDVV